MRRFGAAVLLLAAAALHPALGGAAAPPRVFIETDVDPSSPYVQAAARITVRVYSARALYHADLDLPAGPDVLVRQVGTDDRGSARRDGRSYDVFARQYLVFPQHSGKLTLPGAVLRAQVLTSAGRSSLLYGPAAGGASAYGYGAMIAVEPLELHGDAVSLEVRPRPAGAVSSYWMPARQVTLASAWRPSSLQAHVGDALTLSLTVQAEGLTAEQLPDVSALLTVPQGLKAYPDEPKLDNFTQGDMLVGRREQSIAFIPDRPGRYILPALALRWWDTVHDAPEEVTVPARAIVVLPSQGALLAGSARAAAPAQGAAARSSSLGRRDPWAWASLALGAAWLATLGAWYASRSRTRARQRSSRPAQASAPGAAQARAAFLQACRENDPRNARRNLLAWVDAEWPASRPQGLNDMARQISDPQAAQLLRELDRACYAGGAWSGDAAARALAELPVRAQRSCDRKPPLAPLYH